MKFKDIEVDNRFKIDGGLFKVVRINYSDEYPIKGMSLTQTKDFDLGELDSWTLNGGYHSSPANIPTIYAYDIIEVYDIRDNPEYFL